MLKWVILWSLWAASLVQQPTPPVWVSGGWLRGRISPDGSHLRYLGVPYAINRHRFQPSEPVPPWDGVKDFYEEHIRCTQRYTTSSISGQEDCLVLNIYAPMEKPETPYPVMVFIHGGGFRDGSGSPLIYGPEYLIPRGVLLVTFNYRLEILGFLCLGIKEAPGNIGLRDQVDALKWVKKNIRAFGGDPDNVTLFGESAGSASVLYHIVSPLSTGLFHRAIMQSGSAISPWSIQFDPLEIAIMFAKQLSHETSNPKELYEIFASKSAHELLRTRLPRKEGDIILSENIFVPCIEKKIPGLEPFLSDNPYNLILRGEYNKVPIIIGYNNAEGFMFVGKENGTTIDRMDFYNSIPRDLTVPSVIEKREITRTLKELYTGGKEISKSTLAELARYEGDIGITYPVVATTELLLRTSDQPIYSYKFSHDGLLNMAKIAFGFWKEKGATHADELFYMFSLRVTLPQVYWERNVINKVVSMWTNFAKFGSPTPETSPFPKTRWLPADPKHPRTLIIDKELATQPLWLEESLLYLNSTYTKYRRKQ